MSLVSANSNGTAALCLFCHLDCLTLGFRSVVHLEVMSVLRVGWVPVPWTQRHLRVVFSVLQSFLCRVDQVTGGEDLFLISVSAPVGQLIYL